MLEQAECVKHFVHFILANGVGRNYYRVWSWSPVPFDLADFHDILLINGCIMLRMHNPCSPSLRPVSREGAWM